QADLPHHRRARAADRGGHPRADRASQAGRAGTRRARGRGDAGRGGSGRGGEAEEAARFAEEAGGRGRDGSGGRGEAQAAPRPRREAEGRGRGDRRAHEAEGPAQAAQHASEEDRGGGLMGQKVHPGGLRVGVIHDWKSSWYTGSKECPAYIIEDVKIRDHIYGKLGHAGLSDILIRKDKQRITIDIYTARPGIVIG